jgi:streptomycin 3"-adenylyltransferase
MALPDWIPPAVRIQLRALCEQFQAMFGENLVGIYLHGSLAMRCFNLERSDVDILVVTQQPMSVETKRETIDLLLHLSTVPCPIEISFLVLADIHPFAHPLPFDLHYSETWREQNMQALADGTWRTWNEEQRRDPDLTAHFMIMQHRGIALCGKPIPEVFPAVPAQDYACAIRGDYQDACENWTENRENPVYLILNACRVHAFLEQGHVFSKAEGGIYGLEELPEQFHPLIRQALEIYRGEQPETSFAEPTVAAFIALMDQSLLI